MKKYLIFLLLILFCIPAHAEEGWQDTRLNVGVMGGGAAAGPKTIIITESFTYADGEIVYRSGGVWGEPLAIGFIGISTNRVYGSAGGWTTDWAYHTTTIGSVNQFVKITIIGIDANTVLGVAFRVQGATVTDHLYLLWFTNAVYYWTHSANGIDTHIVTGAFVVGTSFGATITGTGDSTVIRVWNNPTANAPISATEWDSGDSTPDLELTTNPGANAVDTGNYVGVAITQNIANVGIMDNLYAGNLD